MTERGDRDKYPFVKVETVRARSARRYLTTIEWKGIGRALRIDPRVLSAIVLSLLAKVSLADEGIVVARDLTIYDRAESDAFEAGTLPLGAKVVVANEGTGGWLAIEPTHDVFDWIEETAIRTSREPNVARVVSPTATVRSARAGARLPGPPKSTLKRGDMVELVDLSPLRVRFGDEHKTWRAIVPAVDELFYVRADGIEIVRKRARVRVGRKSTETVDQAEPDLDKSMRVDESLAKIGPRASLATLPDSVEAAIRSAEEEHRAMLRRPIEDWQTRTIAGAYQRILNQKDLPAAAAVVVRGRLDELKRQAEAANAATDVDDLLRRGRSREAKIGAGKLKTKMPESKKKRPFDAVGLLQPSSKLHDGGKVFALIARDGLIATYLDIPPGYDTRPLIAHRVGVRGENRYDANIGGKLLLVNELEWLEDED